jgi:RNase P subunit RPR2
MLPRTNGTGGCNGAKVRCILACPTATNLFDDYASAVTELFDASDRLANLVGQHGPFEEGKKYAEQAREKCNVARLALEQHWAQHSCRGCAGFLFMKSACWFNATVN